MTSKYCFPDPTKMAQNLSQKSQNAPANSTDWYHVVHTKAQQIARATNYLLPQVAGVIAALSPAQEWARNLKQAEDSLHAGKSDQRKSVV